MKTIGYWTTDENPQLPDPREWQDHTWDLGERLKVIRYLRDGKQMTKHANMAKCRIGCKLPIGHHDLTDGNFIWPEGFAHYVETHGVKPTEEFLQHIRNNTYKVPNNSSLILKKAQQ